MHDVRFLDRSSDRGPALLGTYDLALMTLSFVVASVAAYAALGVAGRMGAAETPIGRRSWLTAGAASMCLSARLDARECTTITTPAAPKARARAADFLKTNPDPSVAREVLKA